MNEASRFVKNSLLRDVRLALVFTTIWLLLFGLELVSYPVEHWAVAIGIMYLLWWVSREVVVYVTTIIVVAIAKQMTEVLEKYMTRVNIERAQLQKGAKGPKMQAFWTIFSLSLIFLITGGSFVFASPLLTSLNFAPLPVIVQGIGLAILLTGLLAWALIIGFLVLAVVFFNSLLILQKRSEKLNKLSEELAERPFNTGPHRFLGAIIH